MAPGAKRGRGKKPQPDEPEGSAPGIDAVLENLEGVVSELEQGDLPLEQALARFEEGVRLARTGGTLLNALEERVERLLEDRDAAVSFSENDDHD